ncbi:MAG TPA: type II toxin-antitoxin system RelE/ParE family toxin [Longimicrobium sp.]|nr:type II toxin-antitoxin system RelE/ParE family toxin [Longimicrobium sp.]
MSPTARKEISEAADYIFKETGNTALVDRWVDKLLDAFALLTLSPEMSPSRKELRRGLRGHPVGDYIVFYRVHRTEVVIARVIHQRRDLRKVFPKRQKKR